MAARAPGDERCKDCSDLREEGASRCALHAARRREEERLQRERRRARHACLTCGAPVRGARGKRPARYCPAHLEYYRLRTAAAAERAS